MTQYVANPIYDSVFKFMMEDERIARSMLSALLKKEIISVEMRPNEYSNTDEKRISVFRIDFGARVRESDGSEHLILIELQKTWRTTEMMRFRQYLGVQYENKRNVDDDGLPLPIVSIYLLGHKVGDIKEPVIYVSRKYLNYDSQEITDGVPDPFIESLTHDSIIVQIPYLTAKAQNRLEQMLCFFDQSFIQEDPHLVSLAGRAIEENDVELQRIISRLASAAANPDIRHTMNIEDEIFTELENLDTQVLVQKKKIIEQGEQIAQQGEQIAQQGEQIAQQGEQIAQQGEQLAQQGEQLAQQASQLAASVKLMLKSNIPCEVIAQTLGIGIDDVIKFSQQ